MVSLLLSWGDPCNWFSLGLIFKPNLLGKEKCRNYERDTYFCCAGFSGTLSSILHAGNKCSFYVFDPLNTSLGGITIHSLAQDRILFLTISHITIFSTQSSYILLAYLWAFHLKYLWMLTSSNASVKPWSNMWTAPVWFLPDSPKNLTNNTNIKTIYHQWCPLVINIFVCRGVLSLLVIDLINLFNIWAISVIEPSFPLPVKAPPLSMANFFNIEVIYCEKYIFSSSYIFHSVVFYTLCQKQNMFRVTIN